MKASSPWSLAAILLFVVLPALSIAESATLSASERRMANFIDRATPAALDLLERTVNVNSGTMNFGGVREVGRMFRPEFESLGFSVRWVDGAEWGRAGHLIAERPGRGPHVLLIGHLDTVFEPDSPFQRFHRLDDSTARGPGVCDMKGGTLVMLLALRALRETGALERLRISVVLSGDEENAGTPLTLARRDLVAAAKAADIAIGFEDGAGDPRMAVVSRRSASSWMLRTSGKPYHSSQIFRSDIGSGAIFEAARILQAFRDSLTREPYLTFNPGVIVGGTSTTLELRTGRGTAFGKNNVVAESTLVSGDLRALSIEQRERAKSMMKRIVADHLPHGGAEIRFNDTYPPLAPANGNRRLLAMFDQASRDLGFGPVSAVDPARAGAADVSFTEGHVEMAMDGVGLMGEGGHTVQETADLSTLGSQAKRMAVTLGRIAGRSMTDLRRED